MLRLKRWALAVAMAANQLTNALTGGDPDMAVSARAGYARARGSKWGAGTCRVLNWLDPRDGDSPNGDHCTIAVRNHQAYVRAALEDTKARAEAGR
jgi:hypothetical protein